MEISLMSEPASPSPTHTNILYNLYITCYRCLLCPLSSGEHHSPWKLRLTDFLRPHMHPLCGGHHRGGWRHPPQTSASPRTELWPSRLLRAGLSAGLHAGGPVIAAQPVDGRRHQHRRFTGNTWGACGQHPLPSHQPPLPHLSRRSLLQFPESSCWGVGRRCSHHGELDQLSTSCEEAHSSPLWHTEHWHILLPLLLNQSLFQWAVAAARGAR